MREALGAARGQAGQVWGLVAPLARVRTAMGPWAVGASPRLRCQVGAPVARTGPLRPDPLSLEQLDAFLAHARRSPSLIEQLQQPLELEALLALAAAEGFAVSEADVIAAQAREEESLSDEELQRRAGQDARKLRTFIPG